jgi:peroxiredoxin
MMCLFRGALPSRTPAATFVAVALVTFTLGAGCGGEATGPGAASPTSGSSSTAGGNATDFTARDTDGKTVRLADYLGKKAIVLNFWATWCEPCIAEFPHLRKLQTTNQDKLQILGVAMDGPESVANVPAFAKRNQINFPVLLDEDSHVAAIYNPKKSAPLSVLIDKQGRISSIREGYNPGDEEFLAKDISKMLDASPTAQ